MSSEPPAPYTPPEPGWDIGDALGYGWRKLQANIAQLIVAMLMLFAAAVVTIAVSALLQRLLLDRRTIEFDAGSGEFIQDPGSGFLTTLVVNALISALVLVVLLVIGSGFVRGALGITEGRPFTAGLLLRTDGIGPVLVTSLIVGALTFVGTLLCYLPGLVVGFLTSYALYFVIDQDLSPVDAVKASVSLVTGNLGTTLLWYVVGGFAAMLGLLACGVGALFTVPIVLIGTAYTYKKLLGAPIAP